LVFLADYVEEPSNPHNVYDLSEKEIEDMEDVMIASAEADVYWCLSKVIDNIQDNYTEH